MTERRWEPPGPLRRPARRAAALARLLALLPPAVLAPILRAVVRRCRRAGHDDVLEWRNAVNSVSPRCAGNGCLQRSVAVVLLGATRRQAPTWCTGFRTEPFLAHAWVEVDGVPVGEPAVIQQYHRVVVIGPRRVSERGTGE
ncbi:lasso peptide biosynthesis B2 protein [Cellulomonas sp. Y8]|uniref:lasso peptide biosynthesis B2 protein n=1 Tax=Cellulomonas sp. Y8 TaxID=2591145 RepID=UPI003D728F01